MLLYRVEAKGVEVVDSSSQSVSSHEIRGTSLELKRQSLEGRFLPRYLIDHLSPTLIRRQLLEPFLLAIEHTNTRWSVHLMTAESEEIAIHVLHVNLHVRSTLGTVNQHGNIMLVSHLSDLLYGIHCAKHVADMGNSK